MIQGLQDSVTLGRHDEFDTVTQNGVPSVPLFLSASVMRRARNVAKPETEITSKPALLGSGSLIRCESVPEALRPLGGEVVPVSAWSRGERRALRAAAQRVAGSPTTMRTA